MENHLSVREARRRLAEVLNTAAFGDHRIIVVRYREEVGAFVNMDDLQFLRRYRPGSESFPSVQSLRQDEFEIRAREGALADHEKAAAEHGTPERRAQLAEERELLLAERRWIELLLLRWKKSKAAPRN